jgi:hypothetical protein
MLLLHPRPRCRMRIPKRPWSVLAGLFQLWVDGRASLVTPKFSCNTHNYQDQIKSKVPVSAEMFQVEIDLLETKLEEGAPFWESCVVRSNSLLNCNAGDAQIQDSLPMDPEESHLWMGKKRLIRGKVRNAASPPKLDCTDMPVSRSCLTGLDQMRKQKYSPESRFVIAGKRASRP